MFIFNSFVFFNRSCLKIFQTCFPLNCGDEIVETFLNLLYRKLLLELPYCISFVFGLRYLAISFLVCADQEIICCLGVIILCLLTVFVKVKNVNQTFCTFAGFLSRLTVLSFQFTEKVTFWGLMTVSFQLLKVDDDM